MTRSVAPETESKAKCGSVTSLRSIVTSAAWSASLILWRATNLSTCALSAPSRRLSTRCRFAVLLPLWERRSTITLVTGRIPVRWWAADVQAGSSPSLPASHGPPLDLPADLGRRVASRLHAGDECLMLLLVLGASFGEVRDHGQQVVGGREHALLDDFTQFLVARPDQFAAAVLVLCAQYVIDDFVAEILRIADARGLLHLFELRVQCGFVEGDAGRGIHVDLFLNPEVGECHVAIE